MFLIVVEMIKNNSNLILCDFPDGSDGKESTCNAKDLGLIPGSGRRPGEGNGNPLQYSCLEKSIDRGDWHVMVHEVARGRIQLSDEHFLLRGAL